MSTNDVPGARPENHDELAMGCWAEHDDGSLIFVQSTEGGRVVYSIFDMEKQPPIEFRDAMAEGAFKKEFSWKPGDDRSERWTWHDKTPFPWDRLIKLGGRAGPGYVCADDLLNAAERVRRRRDIQGGREVTEVEVEAKVDTLGRKAKSIIKQLQDAIGSLPRGGE